MKFKSKKAAHDTYEVCTGDKFRYDYNGNLISIGKIIKGHGHNGKVGWVHSYSYEAFKTRNDCARSLYDFKKEKGIL